MNNTIFISPATCVDVGQSVFEFCLPVRNTCFNQPTNGRIAICGEEWNCLPKCGVDRNYFIPFTDKIHLQTLFYAGSATNPAAYDDFIDAKICFTDGTEIDAPGLKMSAWKDGKPYQIIELNPTAFDQCFQVKFTVEGQTQEYCSQWYGPIVDCKDYITIKTECDMDCFGYVYGEPDNFVGDHLIYDNTIKIRGSIRWSSFTEERTTNELSGAIISVTTKDEYTVSTSKKLPPFMKNTLVNQMLTCDEIYINNELYHTDASSVSNELQLGNMMRFSFEVYKKCDTSEIDGSKHCL